MPPALDRFAERYGTPAQVCASLGQVPPDAACTDAWRKLWAGFWQEATPRFSHLLTWAMPDEARQFADSVVLSEAEDAWPALLADFKRGALQPVYQTPLPDLAGRPDARRDLFRSKKYIPFQVVQTMRGCPYPCEFCSVSTANGTTMRFRSADEVLRELFRLGKLIMFGDDNVMIHRAYSKDLFTRMLGPPSV